LSRRSFSEGGAGVPSARPPFLSFLRKQESSVFRKAGSPLSRGRLLRGRLAGISRPTRIPSRSRLAAPHRFFKLITVGAAAETPRNIPGAMALLPQSDPPKLVRAKVDGAGSPQESLATPPSRSSNTDRIEERENESVFPSRRAIARSRIIASAAPIRADRNAA